MRIAFDHLQKEFERILANLHFTPDRAQLCARLFAENSLDGVYSHGLNRFPTFVQYIKDGYVHVEASPEKKESFGAWERWDGNLGPGNLNAYSCMNRAIELAKSHGMGCVALSNTNHWMRGGTYGWQAAEAGCIGICFTNTIPNMPPWGGTESRIGNNPLIIALPRKEGHLVLDTAMSLYSYGKMDVYKRKNQLLPFEGGFDEQGNLTRDAGAILQSKRPLPIGYWKGSGLSMMLDMLAAVLSKGNAAKDIGQLQSEYGLSQVFICFDALKADLPFVERVTGELITYIKSAAPMSEGEDIYYPGERTLITRKENLEKGIPVDEQIWNQILQM
jgi:3-dehydro-L-gulonate 2-dehydrogenase